ncbi:hypothetical protein ACFW9O_25115 [Streptomyces sp. NPDC059499]|uniref:Lsr2 family DNA-binding protein n=1 Tax=Streptomyces sp. NPDC059499 TaxID=3346852 RepID=UPI0036D13699
MTIAALQRLLDEELPDVPRYPAPQIPHTARKRQAMQSSPIPGPRSTQQAPSAGIPVLPIGKVIAWAEQHGTKAVARKGVQARALLAELRALYAADEELAQADIEEQRLLQQLADIRARKEKLRPTQRKAPARDYVPADVRAWARAAGLDVPTIGTVPNTIVQAWREAQAGGER